MTYSTKWIKGYHGLYFIRTNGEVYSTPKKNNRGYIHSGKILKQQKNEFGYNLVCLRKNGKSKHAKIHRLVAISFIPNPNKKRCVNHIDGNKNNNHIENLEWVTHSENHQHAYDSGLWDKRRKSTRIVGKMNRLVKNNVVLKIRLLYKSGKHKQSELSKMFNISKYSIYNIVHFKTYPEIK